MYVYHMNNQYSTRILSAINLNNTHKNNNISILQHSLVEETTIKSTSGMNSNVIQRFIKEDLIFYSIV